MEEGLIKQTPLERILQVAEEFKKEELAGQDLKRKAHIKAAHLNSLGVLAKRYVDIPENFLTQRLDSEQLEILAGQIENHAKKRLRWKKKLVFSFTGCLALLPFSILAIPSDPADINFQIFMTVVMELATLTLLGGYFATLYDKCRLAYSEFFNEVKFVRSREWFKKEFGKYVPEELSRRSITKLSRS